MANRVGQQLGNYQLIRLLGEGGFAEVYLGEHVHLGTQAAVKVLTTKLTEEGRALFRNEARTSMGLEHAYQNPSPGTPLCTYRGHSHWVFAVAWSPDGTFLASTGGDGTVQVWK